MPNKSINSLMKHIRESNVKIAGSKHKKQLINIGYFHGYKGYRFYKELNALIPYTTFDEIYSTYLFDIALKQSLYNHVVFIETALKSVVLECVLKNCKDKYIQNMMVDAVMSFDQNRMAKQYQKRIQSNKLNLQKKIDNILAFQYIKDNPVITHYYNSPNYRDVPIWALFENLMLGDFGFLVKCLNLETRKLLSYELKMNVADDSNYDHIVDYIYILKDLRNAIAHNAVVYDARFNKANIRKSILKEISKECGGVTINFKSIVDYVLLIGVLLKKLNQNKTTIKRLYRDYLHIIENYEKHVSKGVFDRVVKKGTRYKIEEVLNW